MAVGSSVVLGIIENWSGARASIVNLATHTKNAGTNRTCLNRMAPSAAITNKLIIERVSRIDLPKLKLCNASAAK